MTGAGRGVGREIALAFARTGARVVCAARTRSEIERVAQECLAAGATDSMPVIMDVTDSTSVSNGVASVISRFDAPGVLCHAAGGTATASFENTDPPLVDRMLLLNLTPAFLLGRAVLPGMSLAGRGSMIFIGSTASRTGYRYCSAYVAAKHGLLGMVRSLAVEVAQRNINVNVVGPGFLDVEATRDAAGAVARRSGRTAEDVLRTYREFSPQQRLFTTAEVAATAVFLASDDARGITGQCILIDGGGIVS